MSGSGSDRRGSVSTRQPIRRSYDLNGLTVLVAAAEERTAAFLDPLVAPLASKPSPACDWRVTIGPAGTIATPESGPGWGAVGLPDGHDGFALAAGDEYGLVVPGCYAMSCRRSSRTIEVRLARGWEGPLGTAALWALYWLLAASGRHLLHAAMVVDAGTERSILLFGRGGAGKTTTALALSRAGLLLAGDDALVLEGKEDGRRLWALPRRIKVGRRTAEMLPWLGPVLAENWIDDAQSLALDRLAPLVGRAMPSTRWTAGLIVILLPPNGDRHAVAPISKAEALAAICHDNLRTTAGGVDAYGAATMAALAELVSATRVTALSVGPEPDTLSLGDLGWP